MQMDLTGIAASPLLQKAAADTLECNAFTREFGLALTEEQAMELAAVRAKSLAACGRIEFGGGVVEKLIRAFCDSPYLTQDTYAETIQELTECFYFYKNDTLDLCGDDEMIAFMARAFNGVCKGSVELLRDREMERMAAGLRYGRPFDGGGDE